MNAHEARIVIDRVAGYYPTPRFSKPEMEIWTELLLGVGFNEARQAVDRWAEDIDASRPRINQLVAAIKLARPALEVPVAEYGPILTGKALHQKLAWVKAQAEGGSGPLVGAIGALFEEEF